MKYVVVTGGVVSGLGKGISISSMGVLLRACGLRVTSIKIDPYLNIDAGTMSPYEHGEVFVLDDGGEADLDLGNYERFLGVRLSREHNITTGKVYQQVIASERKGDYLGKTVQVIPHVTRCIQDWIERVASRPVDGSDGPPDVCLVEVGGTVGDIESLVFLEALRQLRSRVGPENLMFFHVSLVPVLGSVGEQKTKPTQHSVKELRSVGIVPDALICRSGEPLHRSTKEKLALFTQVPTANVLAVHDVSNIYHVPIILAEQGVHTIIASTLKLPLAAAPSLGPWASLAEAVDTASEDVRIALVGKYTGLSDSYLSVLKALKHASIACKRRLVVDWVDAETLEAPAVDAPRDQFDESWACVKAADGILVPGGFGDRGVEGKISAIKHARENKVPFLGVCLGFQCAVIEHARHLMHQADANSTEFNDSTENPVVLFMPEVDPTTMGGTMRLGSRKTVFRRPTATDDSAAAASASSEPSLAQQLYGLGVPSVMERHRHRYEVNPDRVASLQCHGLRFVGTDDTGMRMEILERDRAEHPFFVGVQFHPEFLSRPLRPSPPFHGLLLAASGMLDGALPLAPAAPDSEWGFGSVQPKPEVAAAAASSATA